ncbi:MAG: hypothetical protein K9H64_14385 [Bacteroidales bacterium]|nr:hypothetical protein [Bacteroidales bacterium]MCF8457155.1 hypothetical protein [Bacteroidales bacterium]
MERPKSILLILLIFIGSVFNASAQSSDCLFLNFYLGGDMSSWEQEVIKLNQKNYQSMSESQLYELTLAEYGLIGYLLGLDKDDEAEVYLNKANQHIERLLELAPKKSAYLSMKAALIAFEIPISPYKAMYKGPESLGYIEEAIELDKEEPAAWIEMGNANYHTPRIFGGSVSEAMENYKLAISLMERQQKTTCNWLYPHTMAVLGTYFLETGDKKNAKVLFEKCLNLFPNFKWVKEELMRKVD